MERRKLLQALVALPAAVVTLDGKDVGRSYEIDPKARYLILLNPASIDIDDFCSNQGQSRVFPAGTSVEVVRDSDMDNAIRIFKVSDE